MGQQRKPGASRRGAALIVVVLVVVVVAALAGALTGVVVFSEKEALTSISLNRAFYVASAGVSECVAAVHGEIMVTRGNAATQWALGSADDPLEFAGGTYWANAHYEPVESVTITSVATVGNQTRAIEAILARNLSPIYRSAVFAGNSGADPAYDLGFSGLGGQADEIHGDVYSGGNIVVTGDATIDGMPRADGDITGQAGEAGISQVAPDLAGMEYSSHNDVDVAALFAAEATYASDELGGSAWQLPEASPAHIFRRDPDDRTADTSKTVKSDYFLEDPYEAVNSSSTLVPDSGTRLTLSGLSGKPGPNGSDLLYYIDGNLWIHNKNLFNFTLYTETGAPARVTFVVSGNIYISDNILYQNPDQDGVALIAMKDPSLEDSGNIYFGDPTFGTLERMDAFMFAENNFFDNNLSASGSAAVTVNGNMTAGNQVRINRDWGDQHSKLTVQFDDRLATGELELPGLPGLSTGEERWALVAWREVAKP